MEKYCMPYHWPLRATKVATSILAIQTLAFLPKMILLQSDLPHLSKYKNKFKYSDTTKIATNILNILK